MADLRSLEIGFSKFGKNIILNHFSNITLLKQIIEAGGSKGIFCIMFELVASKHGFLFPVSINIHKAIPMLFRNTSTLESLVALNIRKAVQGKAGLNGLFDATSNSFYKIKNTNIYGVDFNSLAIGLKRVFIAQNCVIQFKYCRLEN